MTTTPQRPSGAGADDGVPVEEKAPSRLVPAGRFAASVLRMPSGLFGANAAWWTIMILAHNLNAVMKRLVLGPAWGA